MMTPVSVRINGMKAQTPFYRGFLLPDGRHALYIEVGSAYLLPVVPFAYDGLYAQDGPSVLIADLNEDQQENAEGTALFLYARLTSMSAYELLTTHYDDDRETYLLVSEEYPDDLVPDYDEYGRQVEG